MNLLVTAFEPFGGQTINPSQQILETLPSTIAGATIHTVVVPTVFAAAGPAVVQAAQRVSADAVVCLGQAGGRPQVCPERVAINVADAPIADNAGDTPSDRPIVADGPAAYFSTMPIKVMVAAMREAGVPAEVSNTAGTFVCNHLMYWVLHHLDVPAGFIHVPYCLEQVVDVAQPAMSVADMTRGISAALEALVQGRQAPAQGAGALH
ncbi:pyroglutamyl-peptidase I [Corynebacterium lizhenjunii]|uniref:pyroglutamyl-peptidase I n=1 Tax=Corynebacterium lizhenjunii TaxID=2709394 RepID=UPI0013EC2343|nr:pyroglutamyl-peptidase I [Corynebacterium lizhenjunii]